MCSLLSRWTFFEEDGGGGFSMLLRGRLESGEEDSDTDARPEHKGFNSVDRLHMRIMSLIPPTILLLAVQMVGFLWFLPLGSRHYVPNPWTETNSIFVLIQNSDI